MISVQALLEKFSLGQEGPPVQLQNEVCALFFILIYSIINSTYSNGVLIVFISFVCSSLRSRIYENSK